MHACDLASQSGLTRFASLPGCLDFGTGCDLVALESTDVAWGSVPPLEQAANGNARLANRSEAAAERSLLFICSPLLSVTSAEACRLRQLWLINNELARYDVYTWPIHVERLSSPLTDPFGSQIYESPLNVEARLDRLVFRPRGTFVGKILHFSFVQ